jgi:hypothetical protein
MNEIWEKLQVVIEKYSALKKKKEDTDKEYNDKIEDVKVEQKKIELLTSSTQEIKKKMDALVDKYYQEEDAYYAQQKLIKKIEWLTREKERAIAADKYKKEREAEERAYRPAHPYQDQIDACEQLISYCNKFIVQKKEEEKKVIEKMEIAANVQSKIAKGELKPVENKKKKEEEGRIIVGGRKKNKDKKDMKKAKKAADEKLDVDYGTLILFDKVQLAPPVHLKDYPATLAKVIEKKTYFQELPSKEAPKEEQKEKVETKLVVDAKAEVAPAPEVIHPVVPAPAVPEVKPEEPKAP